MSDADVSAFKAAGYDNRAILDVFVLAATKLISNYTNHLADTPNDAFMKGAEWSAPGHFVRASSSQQAHAAAPIRDANAAPTYFDAYPGLRMTRDDAGVLVVRFQRNGDPLLFTAQDHTDFVDAFYRISQDRANSIVILTGTDRDFIPSVDFSSFGNVADPDVWSRVHDEGVQILENLANIRVPVIAAVEGRAHVHSEYALMANVIVAGESASFHDLPHFAAGVVPGDGIFTTWSYRAGPGRAEAWLLNPQPITAQRAGMGRGL